MRVDDVGDGVLDIPGEQTAQIMRIISLPLEGRWLPVATAYR